MTYQGAGEGGTFRAVFEVRKRDPVASTQHGAWPGPFFFIRIPQLSRLDGAHDPNPTVTLASSAAWSVPPRPPLLSPGQTGTKGLPEPPSHPFTASLLSRTWCGQPGGQGPCRHLGSPSSPATCQQDTSPLSLELLLRGVGTPPGPGRRLPWVQSGRVFSARPRAQVPGPRRAQAGGGQGG